MGLCQQNGRSVPLNDATMINEGLTVRNPDRDYDRRSTLIEAQSPGQLLLFQWSKSNEKHHGSSEESVVSQTMLLYHVQEMVKGLHRSSRLT